MRITSRTTHAVLMCLTLFVSPSLVSDAMAQGTLPTATRHEKPWQRSFDQGLDPNFLVVGFGNDRGQLGVSNSFEVRANDQHLFVKDPVRPIDGGAFSMVGIDTQLYSGDIYMSAVINPAGLPMRDPIPDGNGSLIDPPEIAMGLLAGGNFNNSELYAGGLDFDTGKVFLLRLSGGMLYPEDAVLAEDSIVDRFPDFRTRSFFIEFSVANRINEEFNTEYADMKVSLYDEANGSLLSTLSFRETPLRDGYTGVFASFRDINRSPDYPTLIASFDDVRLVPEPFFGTLGSLLSMIMLAASVRRQSTRG